MRKDLGTSREILILDEPFLFEVQRILVKDASLSRSLGGFNGQTVKIIALKHAFCFDSLEKTVGIRKNANRWEIM